MTPPIPPGKRPSTRVKPSRRLRCEKEREVVAGHHTSATTRIYFYRTTIEYGNAPDSPGARPGKGE